MRKRRADLQSVTNKRRRLCTIDMQRTKASAKSGESESAKSPNLHRCTSADKLAIFTKVYTSAQSNKESGRAKACAAFFVSCCFQSGCSHLAVVALSMGERVTSTNERLRTTRTTMQVTFYLVSPANYWVKRLHAKTARAAEQARDLMRTYMPDVTICTNECATTFTANGLRFSNGKLFVI